MPAGGFFAAAHVVLRPRGESGAMGRVVDFAAIFCGDFAVSLDFGWHSLSCAWNFLSIDAANDVMLDRSSMGFKHIVTDVSDRLFQYQPGH